MKKGDIGPDWTRIKKVDISPVYIRVKKESVLHYRQKDRHKSSLH